MSVALRTGDNPVIFYSTTTVANKPASAAKKVSDGESYAAVAKKAPGENCKPAAAAEKATDEAIKTAAAAKEVPAEVNKLAAAKEVSAEIDKLTDSSSVESSSVELVVHVVVHVSVKSPSLDSNASIIKYAVCVLS